MEFKKYYVIPMDTNKEVCFHQNTKDMTIQNKMSNKKVELQFHFKKDVNTPHPVFVNIFAIQYNCLRFVSGTGALVHPL